MTAYLAVARHDAAFLISDGAAVDQDGRLEYVVSKPTLFPDLCLAIAVTGVTHPDWVREDMEAIAPADLATAVKSLPLIAHSLAGRVKMLPFRSSDIVLVAVSWDPVAGAAAWTCATGAAAHENGWKPFEVHRIRATLEDITDPSAVLGRPVDLFDPSSFDPAIDGLALMEDCRSRPADPELWGGRTDHYGIGGHVELVTANRDGLTIRRLKAWSDRIGERIAP